MIRISEMYSILYDSTEYYIEGNNNFIEEGYKGYIIKEANDPKKVFVIYKYINKKDRKYIMPIYKLEDFQKKYSFFQNFFNKKMFLLNFSNKILDLYRKYNKKKEINQELLRKLCDYIYSVENNYIHFVALNMSKNEFFNVVKENIKNKDIEQENNLYKNRYLS